MAARALTKFFTTPIVGMNRAKPTMLALKHYQWLLKYAPELADKKSVDIQTIFHEELSICKEMVELLPSKIDRMFHLGESMLAF